MDAFTLAALDTGRSQAAEILTVRAAALATRDAALATHPATLLVRSEMLVEAAAATTPPAMAAARTAGVLVAEGDSWFDYPLHDVAEDLEDLYGYDVESVAHKGDPIEGMAYAKGQLDDFTRRIQKLLRRGVTPKAILLSGGGNDIAGTEFAMLLNHASSSIAGLNEDIVRGLIDVRIYTAYVTILSAVTHVCQAELGRAVPIVLHGYDYAVPDGRGFLGGWWVLPGPWLEPGFREKGYDTMATRVGVMHSLIDRFNAMVATVAALPPFAHVHYIDLRNTLSTGPNYHDWWANELHPTERGFAAVAARFAAVLAALP